MKWQRRQGWHVLAVLLGSWGLSCRQPPAQASSLAVRDTAPTKKPPPLSTSRADVSRYGLNPGSARIVRSLRGPIRIDAYVTRGLARLDEITSDLTAVLTAYEQEAQGRLTFRLIDTTSSELRDQAKADGLQEQLFQDEGTDSARTREPGYLGLVFHYGREKTVIPTLSPIADGSLEFWITNKIREIRDKADDIKHRIGVVTGKAELKLSDTNLVPKPAPKGEPSITSIIQQAFPFYRIEEMELKGGASVIDPELAGLIITQPQQDYVEPELRRIDEFLMRGGKSLVVFASAVNLKPGDTSLEAKLSTRGLNELLDGYGIHLNEDAVFDHGAQFRVPIARTDSPGPGWLRHPALALVMSDPALERDRRRLDTAFTPFFRMDEVIFPFASSLRLMPERQPADVTLRVVARSTPATTVETTDVISMKLRDHWTPKPPVEERALAAYAQGKLRSAFARTPGAPQVPDRAPVPSRLLVISASQFTTNPFAYLSNGTTAKSADPQLAALASAYTRYLTGTILVVKNTFDWMTGDEDLIALSATIGSKRR